MVSYKALWRCPQVYIEVKEYEKNDPTTKYLRSWNLCLKLDSTIFFWASLLMISFEDLNLILYIWVFNTTIDVIMKKIQSNKILLFFLGLWPKKHGFSILEHFFGPLYHACTHK